MASPQHQQIADYVRQLIRNGAGEDFLLLDFQQHRLFFLENERDIRGINLANEEINFPVNDNFEAIDFAHASFFNCTFGNATFVDSDLNFVRIEQTRFINCTFVGTDFFGATMTETEFTGCDFIERNSFVNCDFIGTSFTDCFVPSRIFYDCRFNELTSIESARREPHIQPHMPLQLQNHQIGEIFRGIAEGYKAGGATNRWETAYLNERYNLTRHNLASRRDRVWNFFLEYVTGYGLRPLRVFVAMLITLAAFTILFSIEVGFSDALLLSSGAFFTFGAKSQVLDCLPVIHRIVYIAESFIGVSLVATLITVWANRWFRER